MGIAKTPSYGHRLEIPKVWWCYIIALCGYQPHTTFCRTSDGRIERSAIQITRHYHEALGEREWALLRV
eukprot:scaffold2740_cov122-Skeletonema_marinoi.AAC.5